MTIVEFLSDQGVMESGITVNGPQVRRAWQQGDADYPSGEINYLLWAVQAPGPNGPTRIGTIRATLAMEILRFEPAFSGPREAIITMDLIRKAVPA